MLLTQIHAEIAPIRQAIDAHQSVHEQCLGDAATRIPQSLNTSMTQLQKIVESQIKAHVSSQTKLESVVAANSAEIRKLQAAVEGWASLRESFRDSDAITTSAAANLWLDLWGHVTRL